MAQTRAEHEQKAAEEATKLGDEYASNQRSEAEGAREDQPDAAETEEEYYERVRLASTTGIFGDTDTTSGAGAAGQDVPSANNEAATVAVAEKDAAAAEDPEGESDEAQASDEEARRQVDVSGVQPSAEEVEEGADDDEDSEDDKSDDDDAVV